MIIITININNNHYQHNYHVIVNAMMRIKTIMIGKNRIKYTIAEILSIPHNYLNNYPEIIDYDDCCIGVHIHNRAIM